MTPRLIAKTLALMATTKVDHSWSEVLVYYAVGALAATCCAVAYCIVGGDVALADGPTMPFFVTILSILVPLEYWYRQWILRRRASVSLPVGER